MVIMMNSKKLQKYLNNKKNIKISNKYISNLFTRSLISIIIILLSAIYINISPKNLSIYKKNFFEKSMSFNKINKAYNRLFGSSIPIAIDKGTTKQVFNDKIDYNKIDKYKDGYILNLNNNVIYSLYDGIVVFSGEKEGYGKTIIVQGSNGVDIWYGNLVDISVNLYDYINKKDIIGQTLDNKLYLVFNKENEYLSYEEYLE